MKVVSAAAGILARSGNASIAEKGICATGKRIPVTIPSATPRGTERLRITPTPFHSDALIAELQDALVETWDALGIPYASAGKPAVTQSDRIIPLLVPKSGG